MSDYLVTDTELTSVADAIRTKGGTSAQLEWPNGFITAINNIPTAGPEIVSWASGTDAQIVAMIEAAHAGTIDLQTDGGWAVGDVRTITVGAFTDSVNVSHSEQSIDIAISSFDDYMSCGCVMQFDFKDALSEGSRMNTSSTSAGGYDSTKMFTTLQTLSNVLPSWLSNILIEFSVLSGEGSGSTTIETVTGNKLALRSEVEVLGSTTYSASGEGSQLSYYTTTANRIKKLGHSGTKDQWWLRSPYGSDYFCAINASGNATYLSAHYVKGIAPFGCI